MAQMKTKDTSPRRGRFSWFALCLLIAALVGFCLSLRPRSVSRLWRDTVKDLMARESVLTLASRTLSSGTVALSGAGDGAAAAEAVFSLPKSASLTVTGQESFQLYAGEDKVTLRQGEKSSSANRKNAAAQFDASSFAGEESDLARGLMSFVSLTEDRGDLTAILAPYEKAVKRHLPRRMAEKAVLESDGDRFPVEHITYEFDAPRLAAVLAEWQKSLPGDEALRQWASGVVRLTFAAAGKTAPPETVERLEAFLSGANGDLARLAEGLAAGKGSLRAEFFTASGRICRVSLTWEMPFGAETSRGEADLFLGREPKKSAVRRFTFTDTKTGGESEKTLSLSLADTVTEDSKDAFVRDTELFFSDPAFRLLPAGEGDGGERSVKIKFSWGKKRGDLGLRVTTAEKNVQFRGTLTDFKPGKRAQFVIRRVEVDGENRIPGITYTVSVRPGGVPAALEPGKDALFAAPEPEEVPEDAAENTPENPA